MHVDTFAKLPVHALINDLKNDPKKVNCAKMATFGVTYFLTVGQGPAKYENDCDT